MEEILEKAKVIKDLLWVSPLYHNEVVDLCNGLWEEVHYGKYAYIVDMEILFLTDTRNWVLCDKRGEPDTLNYARRSIDAFISGVTRNFYRTTAIPKKPNSATIPEELEGKQGAVELPSDTKPLRRSARIASLRSVSRETKVRRNERILRMLKPIL